MLRSECYARQTESRLNDVKQKEKIIDCISIILKIASWLNRAIREHGGVFRQKNAFAKINKYKQSLNPYSK